MKNGRSAKYEIIIFWEPTDKVFVAEVPELPGCIAHGKTQARALEEVNVVIDLWLETARKHGTPIPEPSVHSLAA